MDDVTFDRSDFFPKKWSDFGGPPHPFTSFEKWVDGRLWILGDRIKYIGPPSPDVPSGIGTIVHLDSRCLSHLDDLPCFIAVVPFPGRDDVGIRCPIPQRDLVHYELVCDG
jgi:hypothetical protein